MAALAQLLGGLLELPEGTLPCEARQGLEGRVREVLGCAVSCVLRAFATLGGGGPDAKVAYQLCRFLTSVAEVEEARGLLSPDDASAVANGVAVAHPGSEDVQNCARWLWWLMCPSRLVSDLEAALSGAGHVWALRAALWAIPDLARRKLLPPAGQLPSLVLRAMTGAHAADEQVQVYAAAALLALCGVGGAGAVVSLPELSAAVQLALAAHVEHWEVVERLLELSAWTLHLGGHVRLLSDARLTAHAPLLRRLLSDVGARRRLDYSPGEVAACGAISAVVGAAKASAEDVSGLAMYAMWGLLEKASHLGSDGGEVMLEGARVVIQALTLSTASQAPPSADFIHHAFGATLVLAASDVAAVAQPLREHRELVRGLLEVRLAAASLSGDLERHELATCCRLVVALWSVADMVAFVERRAAAASSSAPGVRVDLLRAACGTVNEGAFEAEELRPCAAAVLRMALDLLGATGLSECPTDALTSPAGALGLAIAYIDATVSAHQELVELALRRLLELTRYGVELAGAGYAVLHHAHWAIREAVALSDYARNWVAACPGACELLHYSVRSLILGPNGHVPADEADVEARRALIEGFSVLTLLRGPDLAVRAMCELPESRAVQAAGCAALRDAAQRGLLLEGGHGEAARAALQRACRVCQNEPEVETAACMALGLMGG